MTLELQFGPHGSEHFRWGEFAPPKRVLVQSGPQKVSIYGYASMNGRSARFVYKGMNEPVMLDGLVEFVDRSPRKT